MGMDVHGRKEGYFRANIWQWRAICYAMELAGYEVPELWYTNDREGLETQEECDRLAEELQQFMASWDAQKLTWETQVIRVNDEGRMVEPGTPNSHSPFWVERDHLQEFIDFLKSCGGFEIW